MKKLLFLLLFSPLALLSQNKIIIKSSQVTISSLAPIAASTVVANATGGIATPTAVQLGVGLTFSGGKLAIDTANFKDTIYAMNGLQILGTGFNRIGLGGFLSQNTNISGSNAWAMTLDSMQAATGRGFRVNFGSDAGWDLHTRDSATGFWTRIAKGTPGQVLTMLSTGGIGWGAGGGGSGTPIGGNFAVQYDSAGAFSGNLSLMQMRRDSLFLSVQAGLVVGQPTLSPTNQRRMDWGGSGGGGEVNNSLKIVNTQDSVYEGLAIYGITDNGGGAFIHFEKGRRGVGGLISGALSGDELGGIAASGALSDTARFGYSSAGIHFYALENQSSTNQGTRAEVFVTRIGQDANAGRVLAQETYADSVVFNTVPIYGENFVNASYTGLIVQNLQGGTAASANIAATGSAGTILMAARGGGFSSSGLAIQSSGVIATGSSMTGGLVIAAGGTNPLIFGNNNTQLAQFTGAGTAYYTSAGVNLVYGGSNSNIYRSTNGGSDISGFVVMDQNGASSVTTAGAGAVIIPASSQTTNPVIQFAISNGIRRIGTSAIFGIAGSTTAGSETGEMDFYTKPAGGGEARVLRLNDLQNAIFGGGTTDNANGKVQITGDLALEAAGNALRIAEGSNGRVGQTTLVSGTKAITITGLTTSSRAFITLVTPSGVTLTTSYQAVCTSNTLTIQSNVAAGTINTSDGSTLNYFVIN